jgi:hypothetical protein
MQNVLRFGLCAIVVAGLSAHDCSAAITWNITYQDAGSGFGFDDPTLGATRRNTITAVTNYINTVIDANGVIDLVIDPSNNAPGSGTLASAGSLFFTGPNGFQNGLVFDHATTGVDPAGGVEDGSGVFNFGKNWNSGLGAPASNQFDLFSVALHEFTHALGFASLVSPNGTSEISMGDPGVYSVFDSHLIRGMTGMSLFGPGGDFVGTMGDLISDDVFFDGPNARAANGGNPVKVFSPNPFQSGSSLSHIVLNDAVMQFSIPPGTARREYTPQELGILADLGYNIITPAAVPEPSSYVLLSLVGLAYGLKRRRKGAETDLAV